MKHFILTGAPGAGKTAILRQLEILGFPVVEEAATDVIALASAKGVAQPHANPAFIDAILDLQNRRRSTLALSPAEIAFHDRSAVCTLALADFLGFAPSPVLTQNLQAIAAERFYEKRVFFIRNLGFIKNTDARRINFEDSVRFEQVHEQTYRRLGYDLVIIEPGGVVDRARRIVDKVTGIE